MDMKEKKKKELYELMRELYYNKGLSAKTLAIRFGKSERTIYRWFKRGHQVKTPGNRKATKKYCRSKKYPLEIFNRIVELKREIPQRNFFYNFFILFFF